MREVQVRHSFADAVAFAFTDAHGPVSFADSKPVVHGRRF
jgi:hypothetical protein